MTLRKTYLLWILLAFIPQALEGQEYSFNGQLIGWGILNPSDPFQGQLGGRYIPEFSFSHPFGKVNVEGELSGNFWGAATFTRGDTSGFDKDADFYRAWLKVSGDQFEIRAGLQKINFGSANMLRPLMWFDQLDPKDPLRLTKGVTGVLGRYYFLNNANIWAWVLYGNNESKGLEIYPSKENSIEYGGRIQLPYPIGEMALTFHHRSSDPDALLPENMQLGEYCPENRYAFDTKVDLGVGLWFEGAIIDRKLKELVYPTSTLLNAGLDYTLNLGNGINILTESLYYMQGDRAFQGTESIVFSGVSLSYPISIIHSLSGIAFWDISNKEMYRFINWTMTFDRWSWYLMGYWNPDRYQLPGFASEANIFAGAGIQFMAVFNY